MLTFYDAVLLWDPQSTSIKAFWIAPRYGQCLSSDLWFLSLTQTIQDHTSSTRVIALFLAIFFSRIKKKKWLQLVLLLWVPSLDNKILKLLPVIMNEIVTYSLWRLVSLCCASSRWLQPWSLALSIFSTESVMTPLPSNLIGFLFFSWMVLICKGRESLLRFLSGGQGRDHTAHIIDALGRRLPSYSDLQLFDILEIDHELTKPVLKHLLCKPSTCRLASHFEIW